MLYTRKGDDGTTKTLKQKPGERISKSSCQTEALGLMDELNSFLGLPKVLSSKEGTILGSGESCADIVHEVQNNLFIVQAELAGADKTMAKDKIDRIEALIDGIEKELPPITSFFISGGTELAALFDVSRTLARKAERGVVKAIESSEVTVGDHTKQYLNRLSSLLYALARFANHVHGIQEKPPSY